MTNDRENEHQHGTERPGSAVVAEKVARRLTGQIQALEAEISRMSEERDDAVRQMRAAGHSYDSVAAVLGVSKTRAQQVCNRLEQAGFKGVQ